MNETMPGFQYIGRELELFAAATVWKTYLRRHIEPFLGNEVLEVGAGIGGTTRLLCTSRGRTGTWVCLEPDADLAGKLDQAIARGELPDGCRVVMGTLDQLSEEERFETVLYIDVLEHIEDDRAELARAAERLKPGGHLVVLGPAHSWLFSPFDAAIGHYRRYTVATLLGLAPGGVIPACTRYLDSVGLLASLGNRLILKQAEPTPAQIAFWDKVLVRGSRLLDPLTGYTLGKSALCVWKRPVLDATPGIEHSLPRPARLL
jgi:hypothetical protein